MTSFAEFRKDVELEDAQRQTDTKESQQKRTLKKSIKTEIEKLTQRSTATKGSQKQDPLNMSIKTEIDELHKIKEVNNELQIMQQVSKLQEVITSAFVVKEKERFQHQIKAESNAVSFISFFSNTY